METNNYWYQKYITYKNKYLTLKNSIQTIMIGGNDMELNNSNNNAMELNDNNAKELNSLIHTIDIKNRDEILDIVIKQYDINNEKDIMKLFELNLIGDNMNYVIYYMVLFRYLIKNKKQLSLIDNHITYLTLYRLQSYLDFSLNDDDYLPMILDQIKNYIMVFPIKKVLLIKKATKSNTLDNSMYNMKKTEMTTYDMKNKVFIYDTGEIKDEAYMTYDDLIQILNNIFTFRIFEEKIKED